MLPQNIAQQNFTPPVWAINDPVQREQMRTQLEDQRAKLLGLDRIQNETVRNIVNFFLPPLDEIPVPGAGIMTKPAQAAAFAGKNFFQRLLDEVPRLVRDRQLVSDVSEHGLMGPWYHGTSSDAWGDILKSGALKPHTQTGRRTWTGSEMSLQPGIYLSRDPNTAFRYADMATRVPAEANQATRGQLRPVVLRMRALPTEHFLVDEDIYPVPRMPLTRPWSDSAALSPVMRESFTRPQNMVAEDVKTRIDRAYNALYKRLGGLGNAAYSQQIPISKVETLVGPQRVGADVRAITRQETEVISEVLSRVLDESAKFGHPEPWWLK